MKMQITSILATVLAGYSSQVPAAFFQLELMGLLRMLPADLSLVELSLFNQQVLLTQAA